MISANNITLRVGKKALFEDVNIKFTEGNCYGLIGANGAGKSTFLKILSGQLEPTKGDIVITPGQRLSFLQQDHFKYDAYPVLDTVIMGNERLYQIMKEKEAIYAKEDFTDEDGIRASELEGEFAEMNGWEAESDAATLLNGLGVDTEYHYNLMKDLNGSLKVKVLLAQALFGNPDILLLDEPTNHLDLDAIEWLEEFLINFDNTVIVVSHDRYFLNKVCTQIADIDYAKIQLYAGNYDFWYESSQLIVKQMKEANRKKEEKIKELQDFIQRFSANASKSKQATSRKRALEKIELDEIRPSSRKYPYIDFRPNREIGNEVLTVEHLSKTIDGVKVLDDISFVVGREDKIAFVGSNGLAKTTLFQILAGQMEPDEGSYKWGITTSQSYFPKDNTKDFDSDDAIVDWLTQYSDNKDATYVRQFLGRMLFPGDAGVKKVRVLSGGEKVRVMLSKLMISGANVLIVDEPTDHLDMESITALNNGLIKFPGVLLFSSRDHQVVQTTANRIMEIVNGKLIDDDELKESYATRKPYGEWLNNNLVNLKDIHIPNVKVETYEKEERQRLQKNFGYSFEDLQRIIPMANTGNEATKAMGKDTPLAVLSERTHPLFNYFKQLFAQVTNPPIDAIREEIVTSTSVYLGKDGNILEEKPDNCNVLKINNPILTNTDILKLKNIKSRDLRQQLYLLYITKALSLKRLLNRYL